MFFQRGMKTKYFIQSVLFLILLIPAQSFAQDSVSVRQKIKSKKQPEFKFETETYHFGQLNQGDTAFFEFRFTNTGKIPLVILGAEGSCGCTVPVFPREPILKGEQKAIGVTFYSAGKSGLQEKTITIYSNAFTNPKVLHLKGNVKEN